MNGADLFHAGIVTDDLETTLQELSDLLGYEWCDQVEIPTTVVLPSGEDTIDLRFAYSKTEPRLEIIRSVPGTLWTPAEGSGIHHLGYWSNDVAADQDRLTARGYLAEAVGVQPDGVPYWGYYRRAGGHRIELISREVQGGLELMWRS